ncbi:MAG: hypothetical protein AB7R89_03435 [Dehalococcoidia bacterium]
MPGASITLVYSVEAPSKLLASLKVSEAVSSGIADGVTQEFASVQMDPESLLTINPAGHDPSSLRLWVKAWAEEVRDQLLGPSKANQQPVDRKSQS